MFDLRFNLYSVWLEILFMAIIAGALAVFTWNKGSQSPRPEGRGLSREVQEQLVD